MAGAQPKTALLFVDGRWGVPSGRIPTTHILKPVSGYLEGQIENEHFCLALANAVGLSTAHSELARFGAETALIIERYDRRVSRETPSAELPLIHRIHQEDFCQALGLLPDLKYQSGGGPSPTDLVELLRRESSKPDEDVERFIDAFAFNWLIAGTDAHAKNYSLLHGRGASLRLAPLYDLANDLRYDDPQRTKLAMKVGGQYRLRDIRLRQWERVAEEFGLETQRVISRVAALAEALPDAIRQTATMVEAKTKSTFLVRLADQLLERVEDCLARLGR